MDKGISVNTKLCEETGKLIRELRFRPEFYDRPFLKVKAADEVKLRGYFYAVAICHQTYRLHHAGLQLYGWDYIEHVFTKLMAESHAILKPGALKELESDTIAGKLASLFAEDGNPEHTTLNRLTERAEMLKELDAFVEDQFGSSLQNLMESTESMLVNAGHGFYETLASVSAFSDPMKKKITFLLKLLEEAGMVCIADKQHFIPIMDYHMQRVLLRMGCVEITDPALHEALTRHTPLTGDEAIRSACIEAASVIAAVSGHAAPRLNDVLWSLGRSCCNINPLCTYSGCEKKPCTFGQIVDAGNHDNCYFEKVCRGYSDEKFRKLWQPVVETHYY